MYLHTYSTSLLRGKNFLLPRKEVLDTRKTRWRYAQLHLTLQNTFLSKRLRGSYAGDGAEAARHEKPLERNVLFLAVTVLIEYCDYHPVTKSPRIGSCDYSQMSF